MKKMQQLHEVLFNSDSDVEWSNPALKAATPQIVNLEGDGILWKTYAGKTMDQEER